MDKNFPKLNGLRVVRIATHPDAHSMGYGSRALTLLRKFFLKELNSDGEQVSFYNYNNYSPDGTVKNLNKSTSSLNDALKPRKKGKPLLKNLSEITPPKMHYLGVSFGLTQQLLKFWKANLYEPVYIKQKSNGITGEHSCIMLQDLKRTEIDDQLDINPDWIAIMKSDFEKRFISLLGFNFRNFTLDLSLSILKARLTTDNLQIEQEDQVVVNKVQEITTRVRLQFQTF